MLKAAIYARFSSSGQNETSIIGQVMKCEEYASLKGYEIYDHYIDRAKTGTSDKRDDFQRMIHDAQNGYFDVILVYQFDRFFRDAVQSGLYKSKLQKVGVEVLSVLEPVTEGPMGILQEGMIDLYAEFFSADLAQKTRRGMRLNANRKRYNGGTIAFGFKINDEKHFEVVEEQSIIVQKIFNDFIEGKPIKDILKELNNKHILNTRGTPFTYSTIEYLLANRKYCGFYIYDDIEIQDETLRIIDDKTFRLAQERLKTAKHTDSKSDYYLSGKLYCGDCKSPMTGVSGVSRNGSKHYYYRCKSKQQGVCNKRNIPKEKIESLVYNECLSLLTPKVINDIAVKTAQICEKEMNDSALMYLTKEENRLKNSIQNLLKVLECGRIQDTVIAEIEALEKELKKIQTEIAQAQKEKESLSEDAIAFFLNSLRKGIITDSKYKKGLFDIFLNKVFLYDDHCTIYFNTSSHSKKIQTNFIESDGLSVEYVAPPLGIEPRTNL